jgi:hypothetical protein
MRIAIEFTFCPATQKPIGIYLRRRPSALPTNLFLFLPIFHRNRGNNLPLEIISNAFSNVVESAGIADEFLLQFVFIIF